jgi:hypothetical protein
MFYHISNEDSLISRHVSNEVSIVIISPNLKPETTFGNHNNDLSMLKLLVTGVPFDQYAARQRENLLGI